MINRINKIIKCYHFFANRFNLIYWQSIYRSDWQSVFLIDPNDNISSALVCNIIGESTNRTIDRIWIPSFFKLNPMTLDSVTIKKSFNIDR